MKRIFISAALVCCLAASAQNGIKESETTYAKEALQPYLDQGVLAGAISVFYKDGEQEGTPPRWRYEAEWEQRPYNDRHVFASTGAGLWTTAAHGAPTAW